jgi:hypothetical protein
MLQESADEEERLERLIVEAELRGRRTVADALARRLDALRAERSTDVVSLSAARARQTTLLTEGPAARRGASSGQCCSFADVSAAELETRKPNRVRICFPSCT